MLDVLFLDADVRCSRGVDVDPSNDKDSKKRENEGFHAALQASPNAEHCISSHHSPRTWLVDKKESCA